RAKTWSTAAARSGTESTRVPSRSNITRRGKAPSNSCSSVFMSALDLGQFGTHLVDHGLVVRRIEDCRASDEGISPGLGYLADILHIDTTVDLQADIAAAGVDQSARLAQLVEGARDELLATEARVDAHQQ